MFFCFYVLCFCVFMFSYLLVLMLIRCDFSSVHVGMFLYFHDLTHFWYVSVCCDALMCLCIRASCFMLLYFFEFLIAWFYDHTMFYLFCILFYCYYTFMNVYIYTYSHVFIAFLCLCVYVFIRLSFCFMSLCFFRLSHFIIFLTPLFGVYVIFCFYVSCFHALVYFL